jgi:hypothetical protein
VERGVLTDTEVRRVDDLLGPFDVGGASMFLVKLVLPVLRWFGLGGVMRPA